MEITLTVKTNRIHFEKYESPAGIEDRKEYQLAWESAIYKAIESAGCTAETEVGVGFDPAVNWYISICGVLVRWNGQNIAPDMDQEITKITEKICYCDESCDTPARMAEFVKMILPTLANDLQDTIENAISDGDESCNKLEQEIIKNLPTDQDSD